MKAMSLRIALVGADSAVSLPALPSPRGFDVRIFEQSNEIKEVGGGIVDPNAVKSYARSA